MGKWLRRIRGAVGMGLTWGFAWSLMGFIPRWVFGMNSDLPFGILFGGLGFIAGVTFSGLLVLAEGRRRFDQMSLPRLAAWGALGGLVISALFVRGTSLGWGAVLGMNTMFAVACAASASGTLAVARRAERRELRGATDDDIEAHIAEPDGRIKPTT